MAHAAAYGLHCFTVEVTCAGLVAAFLGPFAHGPVEGEGFAGQDDDTVDLGSSQPGVVVGVGCGGETAGVGAQHILEQAVHQLLPGDGGFQKAQGKFYGGAFGGVGHGKGGDGNVEAIAPAFVGNIKGFGV